MTGLAVEAAQKALQMAEVEADEVDLILFCSSTPDDLFGGAPEVQKTFCNRNPPAYDIRAACTGFLSLQEKVEQVTKFSRATKTH
ncbi:3-oxoacyl-[acyl-carrier-protein] synthase III, chloroplastic-like protein [Tanacetum coccineum]